MPLTPQEELALIGKIKGQEQQQEMVDPTADMSTGERVLAGAGRGMVHAGRSLGNLIPGVNKFSPFTDAAMQEEAELDRPLMSTAGGQVGNFLGETAATLPVGLGGGKAAQLAARYGSKLLPSLRALEAGTGAGNVFRTMAEGASQGAVAAEPGDRGAGAVMGGGAGALLPLAGKATSFLRSGMSRTPEAQVLLQRGIDLPPGMLNPGGLWSSLEEKAQALPIVGKAFEKQRANARTQFQQRVIQDVAPPHPTTPERTIGIEEAHPNNMIDNVRNEYKWAWDELDRTPLESHTPYVVSEHPPVSTGKALRSADIPPAESMVGTPGGATIEPIPTKEALKRTLSDGIKPSEFPMLHPEDLAHARSSVKNLQGMLDNMGDDLTLGDLRKVREHIKTAKNDAFMAGKGDLGAMWKAIDQRFTDVGTSALNSQSARQFNNLDRQYARFKVVEDAMAHSKDRPSGFTPHELSSAVSNATSQGEIAAGKGLLRDWSKPFAHVFTQYEPKTGWQTPMLAAGEAGAAYLGLHNPVIAGTVAGAIAAPYTAAGRHFLQGKTMLNKAATPLDRLVQAANDMAPFRQAALTALRQHNPIPGVLGSAGNLADSAKSALSSKYGAQEQPPAEKPEMAKGGKVATVMHEWKAGKLHSGSKTGPKVTSQKQAIAIALSEQRKADR